MNAPVRSLPLNHLGLVAGMIDELGLCEVIDEVIPQDKEQRKVTAGQAVRQPYNRDSR